MEVITYNISKCIIFKFNSKKTEKFSIFLNIKKSIKFKKFKKIKNLKKFKKFNFDKTKYFRRGLIKLKFNNNWFLYSQI